MTSPPNPAMMCREGTDCEVRFVKDDEEDLPAKVQDGGRDRRGEGREDPLPGRCGARRGPVPGRGVARRAARQCRRCVRQDPAGAREEEVGGGRAKEAQRGAAQDRAARRRARLPPPVLRRQRLRPRDGRRRRALVGRRRRAWRPWPAASTPPTPPAAPGRSPTCCASPASRAPPDGASRG